MDTKTIDPKPPGWVDEPFIKLIPISWVVELCKLPPSAIRVGLLIFHKKGYNDKSPWRDKHGPGVLTITRSFAHTTMRIPPRTLTEGLNRLEKAGLITSSRGRGRAIRVTIVNVNKNKTQTNSTTTRTFPSESNTQINTTRSTEIE